MEKGTDSVNDKALYSPDKWFWRISLFFLLLPILLSAAPFVSGWGSVILQSGDNSLLEMATDDVSKGVYTGAYSRFGFHHPGPLYFYLRYPLYALSEGNASSFYIVTALIAGFSLWGAVYILRKISTLQTSLLFSAVFSFFMLGLTRNIWLSQWNPFVIIFPIGFCVIALSAFSSGATRYFPFVVISASFAAQTHLGALPSMSVLILYGIFLVFYRKEFLNRYFVISMVFGFILWIPVFVDQISSNGTGNLTMISDFLSESSSTGISRVTISAWSSAVASIEMVLLGSWVRRQFQSPAMFQTVIAAGKSLLLIAAWLIARRRKRTGFETRLCEITILLIIVSLASVFSIRGEAHQYLTTWIFVVSPLSLFSILLVFLRTDSSDNRNIRSYIFLSFLLIFTFLNVKQVKDSAFSTDPLGYHDEDVESISRKIFNENQLLDLNLVQVIIEDNSLWPQMAGLVCNLRKHGYRVAIQDDYAYMLNTPNPIFSQSVVLFLYRNGPDIDYLIEETE